MRAHAQKQGHNFCTAPLPLRSHHAVTCVDAQAQVRTSRSAVCEAEKVQILTVVSLLTEASLPWGNGTSASLELPSSVRVHLHGASTLSLESGVQILMV